MIREGTKNLSRISGEKGQIHCWFLLHHWYLLFSWLHHNWFTELMIKKTTKKRRKNRYFPRLFSSISFLLVFLNHILETNYERKDVGRSLT